MKIIMILFLLLITSCAVTKHESHYPTKDSVVHLLSDDMKGTGFVIGQTIAGSVILTVNHVCDSHPTKIMNSKQQVYDHLRILKQSKESDLCLIFVSNFFAQPVTLSKQDIVLRQKIWSITAPYISYKADNRLFPIMEGYVSDKLGSLVFMHLPSGPGASGSPIFNSSGELVGVLSMVMIDSPIPSYMYFISLSVRLQKIYEFLGVSYE